MSVTIFQMDTLESRDRALEMMWADLADVPFDEDADGRLMLSEKWMCFEAGTKREDVWRWFDERYSRGVAYLLYGNGVDRTPEVAQLVFRKMLCEDCDSADCAYNDFGVCRLPMVYGRKPSQDDDGCHDYIYAMEGYE